MRKKGFRKTARGEAALRPGKARVTLAPMKKRRPLRLPVPECSDKLLVTLPPQQVGMFRFLLEGYDNIASFTVLDRSEALLKVFFSPHQHGEARSALEDISGTLDIRVRPWPVL